MKVQDAHYIRDYCFLCKRPLEPLDDDRQRHPDVDEDGLPVEDCLAKFCDRYGIPIDDELEVVAYEPPSFEVDVQVFPFVEVALEQIFAAYGIERLGGKSSGRGWSSFSTFQRCWWAYKRRYIDKSPPHALVEPESRAIGTVIHALLAIYYLRMIQPDYPLTPDMLNTQMMAIANPKIVVEAWRVFYQYALYYQLENIQPLGIEENLVDPRTGESCRFDLIAFYPERIHERLPGTYIIEHKSVQRFDRSATDGWANDGEVLGQVMLWKRLGLDKRYGPLRGVIVNLLGRQKEPKFHRTTVAPGSWQIEQHRNDLKRTEGLMQLARSMDMYPRMRAGCITRYGFCENWESCASDE